MDYRSRLYESYVRTHFSHIREISREAMDRQRGVFRHYFAQLLPADRGARILEIGCGYGGFLYYLQAEGYRNIEGIDVSQEQIKAAHQLGLSFALHADAMRYLQGRPERYCCVVAIDFLDHFPKEQVLDVLTAIYRSLLPGGTVILQAMNADGPFAGRLRYADFTHEFALTAGSSRQILEGTGFDDVRVFGTDPFAFSLASMVRVVVWKIIKAFLWVYLVAETGAMHSHVLTQNLIAVARRPTTSGSDSEPSVPPLS